VPYLQVAHLGNDMAYPTHTILCDYQAQKMYVGNYQEIRHFVKTHRASPNDARCKSVMQSACPTEIQSTTNSALSTSSLQQLLL
jgi:hypothetical protein